MPLLINVCGPARSGTTMLDLMLGNAEDAFSCGEVYAWYRPWRRHHFSINCSCGMQPCPVWAKLKDIPESHFHAEALKTTGSNYIVDSSKELCWVIDNQEWARQAGMDVANLLIWKSPVDLAYSHWKRGHDIMFWRKQFVNYYKEFFSAGLPYFSIAFDALSAHPAESLANICSDIGMPYFEGKEEFWTRRHHHLFGSMGTRKQMEAGLSQVVSSKYPEQFMAEAEQLTQRIEQDTAVQDILHKLAHGPAPDLAQQAHSLQRPWWYYYKRARQRVYGIFPKPAPDGH